MSDGGGITIGVDIGTTSVKAVAVDAAGHVLERVRLPHPLITDGANRFEHDVDRAWRQGPRRAVAALAHHDPAAVAVSTMVPSLAPLTARGRPLGPGLLYGDARGRADGEADEPVGFLRWLAASYPEAAHLWPASAVANHALSGRGVADIATCFTMGSLLGDGGWSADVCAAAGTTPAVLPELGGSGDRIGTVKGTDIAMATGSVDGWCEQLVAGATQPGDVLVLCGTTLLVWVVTEQPVEVEGLWTHPTPSGGWVVGGASNAGGLFLDWLSRLTGHVGSTAGTADTADPTALRRGPTDHSPREANHNPPQLAVGSRGFRRQPTAGSPIPLQPAGDSGARSTKTPSGWNGLGDPGDVPVVVPYIRGERTPFHDHALRGSVHGLHLGHSATHLQRAGWEASAFVVKHHLELIGLPMTRVIAAGGGTKVDGWMQALADVVGQPVEVAADAEGAAKGAAWLARMAVGLDDGAGTAGAAAWARTGRKVEPGPRWTTATAERYARFRSQGDSST